MTWRAVGLFLFILLIAALLAVACAGSAERAPDESQAPVPMPTAAPRGPTGPPGQPGLSVREMPSTPAATPAPVPTAAPQVPEGGYGMTEEQWRQLRLDADSSSVEEAAALVAQQRIIVRTVDMRLVVQDVSAAMDGVSRLAQELGGWVVTSDRSARHQGSISIRVPATRLDEAVQRLRGMAAEVEAEITSSKDVTDEYVDTSARLTNLQATEQALLRLLEGAQQVDDALNVQRELTKVQEEIERLQGRIKFLEETAAFSLINVTLKLAPVEMSVDAGPDQTVSVDRLARFRASFRPPEGITDFVFTWDFGDGSGPVTLNRTAPTQAQGTRATSTVTHSYGDDRDSPFIVEVRVTGTGEAGVAEGKDTILVTVTRVPVIEVFAGTGRTVEEDREVEFVGTFTRPEGLSDLRYRWDFGDGTAPAEGSLPEGVTQARASHLYRDPRPSPYTATLTIRAQSAAGPVEASHSLGVQVTKARGWTISGWAPMEQGKSAVRALSGLGQALGTVFIWLGIFSPVWLIAGAVVLAVRRGTRRRRVIAVSRQSRDDS